MAKRKCTPQAPPAAAGRKKKARETPEEASGAGPSQPPSSRPKKGARRGGQAPPVEEKDPNVVEGPYMVEFERIPDPDRRIRWGHVTKSAKSAILAHLREREITGSGLSFALELPVHRPHIPACLEFIQSVVPIRQERESRNRLDLPMEGTVRGRTVRLDTALVREAFVLPRASLEIKRQVRHSLISDWFSEYQGSGKRYIARTCRRRDWGAALELISMMLLASRRPRTIPGRLTYYIKKFDLDPEEEPEKRLDFADFMAQSLRREVFAVQAHLKADKPERSLETFVAIPLTHILIHLRLLTGLECDESRAPPAVPAPPTALAAPADPSGVEAAPKKGLDVIMSGGKSLVVRPRKCLVGFLEGLQKRCQIIIWSRLSYKSLMSYLEALVQRRYLPKFLLDPQSDVPAAAREILLTDWPHFHAPPEAEEAQAEEALAEEAPRDEEVAQTRVEGAPVEEAPPVEEVAATTVEGAPVEEAPPVEEVAATRVEGAPVEEAPSVEEVAATRVEGALVDEAPRVEEATQE
ncbi:hypothetical protein R1sor_002591 [Riccia sorocarpa]|uniref:Uncharacterized protein n=1 Tax=Riccia sorocarpa TaxID=122646 RepID=A0ABD3H1Y5_9MARC